MKHFDIKGCSFDFYMFNIDENFSTFSPHFAHKVLITAQTQADLMSHEEMLTQEEKCTDDTESTSEAALFTSLKLRYTPSD